MQQRDHHQPHHVGWNGEADALAPAAFREDCGVDPDQPTLHVHQRAARVAGVDGRVGLDEELIVRNADARAGERRDDAAGNGLADAERIADGQHQVAHLKKIGVGEGEVGEFDAGYRSARPRDRCVRP